MSRTAVAGRGLVCQFGPGRAVDDVSFEAAEGEVFGLLGQLTGYEHVWLFARLFDVPRRQRRGRVDGALAAHHAPAPA